MTQSKGNIIVIDDDLALQTMLEMALRNGGYEVVLCRDGEEGLQQLESLQPDLVISDIMMPNMDGFEMFQHIKDRLQDDGIPIIIITALNRKPWFEDMEAEGAAILHKPFSVERLVDLVNVFLDPG
jgi:CheY-like chemotaxis protein